MLEHRKSACGFFVSLVSEFAVIEAEESVLLCEKVWHHLDKIILLVLIDCILARDTAIHENVPLS